MTVLIAQQNHISLVCFHFNALLAGSDKFKVLNTFAFVNEATKRVTNKNNIETKLHITSHSSIVYSVTTQFKYNSIFCYGNIKTKIQM